LLFHRSRLKRLCASFADAREHLRLPLDHDAADVSDPARTGRPTFLQIKNNFQCPIALGPSDPLSNPFEMVVRMVSRFEVRVRTTREWERTILRSFEVWRESKRARGGVARLELRAGNIEVLVQEKQ
ncbi:MAG: hypothetical protein WCA31_07575, partial [Acidimicrobiales bacterium]